MADADDYIDQLDAPVAQSGGSSKPKRPPAKSPYLGGSGPVGGINQRPGAGTRQQDVVYDVEAGTVGIAPRYREDDQWMFLRNGARPDTIASVNTLLMKAGLISGEIPLGSWLDKSAKAFSQVLAYANRTGMTWDAALQELAADGEASGVGASRRGGGGGGATRAAFQPRLSNPDDLKEVFKQAAYNTLGGRGFVDDAQLEGFVRSYQEKEIASQRAAFSGAKVVDAPQADTAALAQLKETDPDGYQATQFANYGKLLEGLIGGVSG